MKTTKTALFFVLAGAVAFTVGLWFYSTRQPLGLFEYGVAIVVLLVVVFSLYVGRKRINDEKKGLPAEDELSKVVKQKAGASAFMASFYVWTLILVIMGNDKFDTHIPLGLGILAMAVLFVVFWFYYAKNTDAA